MKKFSSRLLLFRGEIKQKKQTMLRVLRIRVPTILFFIIHVHFFFIEKLTKKHKTHECSHLNWIQSRIFKSLIKDRRSTIGACICNCEWTFLLLIIRNNWYFSSSSFPLSIRVILYSHVKGRISSLEYFIGTNICERGRVNKWWENKDGGKNI
jgi:hypothetical protein